MKERSVTAAQFKAHCSKIIETVKTTGRSVIITKRNVPYAKIVPLTKKEDTYFGCMKGTIRILGDIVAPIDEKWDADT